MERACITPDQFFDHLDILFGANDGYIPHLERIRALIEDIQQYKDTLDEHFHHYDLLKKKNDKLQEENEKLEAKVLLLQSSEEGLEKKLDTGGWSPTSSPEPKK